MFSTDHFGFFNITPNQMYELGNLVALYLLVIYIGLWGMRCIVTTIRCISDVYGDDDGERFGYLFVPVVKLAAATVFIGILLHTHVIWRTLRVGDYVNADWLNRPISSFGDFVLAVIAGSSDPIAQMMQFIMAIGVAVLIAAVAYILNITPTSRAWFGVKWNQLLERRTSVAQTKTVSES